MSMEKNAGGPKLNFTEEELSKAARELCAAYSGAAPGKVAEYQVSDRFKAKINVLISREKLRRTLKRLARSAAALLLSLALISGTWLIFDVEARAGFGGWLKNSYENSIIYEFFGRREEQSLAGLEFGWLPGGYSLSARESGKDVAVYLFTDPEGSSIVLSYGFMYSGSFDIIHDEGLLWEELIINGGEGCFYLDPENGETLLWWTDPEKGLRFELNSLLTKEEALKFAENILYEPTK